MKCKSQTYNITKLFATVSVDSRIFKTNIQYVILKGCSVKIETFFRQFYPQYIPSTLIKFFPLMKKNCFYILLCLRQILSVILLSEN